MNNDLSPDRRLRIGYVSPDLRQDALARYFEPVLANHDPRKVEVFCYAEVPEPECRHREVAKIRIIGAGLAVRGTPPWPRASGLTKSTSWWTWRGTPKTIAWPSLRKSQAPVQATWLGYLNTTGLPAIDYRMTDEVLDPPGLPVRDSEELWRLPHGMCCFAAALLSAPPVTPLPASRRGYLTFGSLNHLIKLNSGVYDLWSKVLQASPRRTIADVS